MNKFPLITIGLLTYNNSETIERALNGLVSQSYLNYEILIFDDCSNDNTVEILKAYSEKYQQIKLRVNQKNLGIMKNFELLLNNIRGEYFLWACPDDVYSPRIIEVCFNKLFNTKFIAVLPQVSLIIKRNIEVLNFMEISKEFFLKDYKNLIQSLLYRKNEQYCLFWHSLVNSKVIKKLVPFYPSYFSIEEIFSIYLIMQGGITTVPEVLWDKYQSSLPLEERIKESYDISYGFKNKLLCAIAWIRLYRKYKLEKTSYFVYVLFRYFFYWYFTKLKRLFYNTYKFLINFFKRLRVMI